MTIPAYHELNTAKGKSKTDNDDIDIANDIKFEKNEI